MVSLITRPRLTKTLRIAVAALCGVAAAAWVGIYRSSMENTVAVIATGIAVAGLIAIAVIEFYRLNADPGFDR